MDIVVFWEEGFPFVDTAPLTQESLRAALKKHKDDVSFSSSMDLPTALRANPQLFVNPYGSAFPKNAWTAIITYLRGGGNFVNLGGVPFTRPVRGNHVYNWLLPETQEHANPQIEPGREPECAQTQYGKAIRLNHAFPIELSEEYEISYPRLDLDLEPGFRRFNPKRAWSLQVRFTTTKDFPEEGGSSGPREAFLHTLAFAERDGRKVAAPVIAIDRLLGEFAGGRWVLACCEADKPIPPDLIGRLCDYAIRPRVQISVSPSFGSYHPGEMAALTVAIRANEPADHKVSVRVYSKDTNKEVYVHDCMTQTGFGLAIIQSTPFSVPEPGLYIVRTSVEIEGHSKPIGYTETGFWVYDRELISSGQPLSIDPPGVTQNPKSKIQNHRDYFYRNGQPYPITGTTYMAGDVHRKFLFEPNAAVWDADFTHMKEAGVNMVRTGIWTGWMRIMAETGNVDEGVLRAFEAFLLTARRYDITVIFTFFAFIPESWGGKNPYLDPQSVAAQSAFISAFTRRFANVNDLLWDFINEPSFCSPERVWSTRPNYDEFERAAWAKWLTKDGVSEDEWRERWRLTPEDPLGLPALEDFNVQYIFQDTHPLKVMDYRLFAQEMFAEWVAKLKAVVRENGNPHQLVSVGQDEGGTGERPNPWFHSHVVDFTCNHSWWQNDDLLWDSVITKTPYKPNLIGETGVMFVEGVDGRAWRTEEECRNLLERKMALAFAGGCAGFIQWCWNTNVYMDSDNEVAIGFLRADGTEKPELEAFRGIARFFAENAHRMVGRKLEEAVVVIPHSNMFSVRDLATQATKRAVRTLEYGLGIPCRAVSEYAAEDIGAAKLIVLPSARVLTEKCWHTLIQKVEAGATLLVTGYIEADPYCRGRDVCSQFAVQATRGRVSRNEEVALGSGSLVQHCTFAGDSIQKLEKAEFFGKRACTPKEIQIGHGFVVLAHLPIELTMEPQSGVYLYQNVAKKMGLSTKPGYAIGGALVRYVEYADGNLCILFNETYEPGSQLADGADIAHGLTADSGRVAMALVDRDGGEVVAKYESRKDGT